MLRICSKVRCGICWGLALGLLLAGGTWLTAEAQQRAERLPQARKLFVEGQAFFATGSLHDALERFLAAERLVPSAELAYNIGHLYDLVGEPEEAARFLRLYLSRSRGPVPDREQVTERIERLQRRARRERQILIGSAPGLSAEARAFFERALQMFDQQRYREALGALLTARRIVPAPEIDYNLAVTSEKLGLRGDAIDYYRVYLHTVKEPDEREAIERKIQQLEAVAKTVKKQSE